MQRVLAFTTLLIKHAILLQRKHTSPPHDSWIQEILLCIKLEKLWLILKGCLESFHKTRMLILLTFLLSHLNGQQCLMKVFYTEKLYVIYLALVCLFIYSLLSYLSICYWKRVEKLWWVEGVCTYKGRNIPVYVWFVKYNVLFLKKCNKHIYKNIIKLLFV